MLTQWIEQCTVQRMSLRGGLVLNLDDYNELVISRPLRLTLPPVAGYPEEEVLIDPAHVPDQQRPLLDLAGAVCTHARCDDEGCLHLSFSRGTASTWHRTTTPPRGSSTASTTATWCACHTAGYGWSATTSTTTIVLRRSDSIRVRVRVRDARAVDRGVTVHNYL